MSLRCGKASSPITQTISTEDAHSARPPAGWRLQEEVEAVRCNQQNVGFCMHAHTCITDKRTDRRTFGQKDILYVSRQRAPDPSRESVALKLAPAWLAKGLARPAWPIQPTRQDAQMGTWVPMVFLLPMFRLRIVSNIQKAMQAVGLGYKPVGQRPSFVTADWYKFY